MGGGDLLAGAVEVDVTTSRLRCRGETLLREPQDQRARHAKS